MIDLEQLAIDRARSLDQPERDWLAVVQKDFFQQLCAVLSDGDIARLIIEAPSISEFEESCLKLLPASVKG